MSGQGQAKRPGITRRQMLARTGALAGGVALAGAGAEQLGVSPIGRARAVPPVLIAAGALAGGAAVGYLSKVAADKYLGDERDYSGYTGADALHTELNEGSLEMRSADERVMTGIQNNIQASDNVALAKGKAAIIEEMNAGNGESTADNAMKAAINGYYADIQKNILTHHNEQMRQIKHHLDQVAAHANLVLDDVYTDLVHTSNTSDFNVAALVAKNTYPVTLVDGTTKDVVSLELDLVGKTSNWALEAFYKAEATGSISTLSGLTIREQGGTNYITVFAPGEFVNNTNSSVAGDQLNADANGGAWNRLLAARDDVLANLSGFVTDVYDYYDAGEIPTEDLVDPITAATELQQDYDGYQTQGAHAAMLGIPTSAAQAVDIEVNPNTTDAAKMTVDMFTDHQPVDSNGDPTGFEAGNTYEPSTWSEPLYIAYQYTEEVDGEIQTSTDFVQLEDPFFIRDIVEKDGTSVNSFSPESTTAQTVDVAELKTELEKVRQEKIRLQEKVQDTTGGGGGLFDGLGNVSTTALAAGGAGVAALLALASGS